MEIESDCEANQAVATPCRRRLRLASTEQGQPSKEPDTASKRKRASESVVISNKRSREDDASHHLQPGEQVQLIVSAKNIYQKICDQDGGYLLRSYNLKKPQVLHVVVGSSYMGSIYIDFTSQVQRKAEIAQACADKILQKFWEDKLKNNGKIYLWHVAGVKFMKHPFEVKFIQNKLRYRHFVCDASKLLCGVDIPLPKPSLSSTNDFS